MINVSEFLAAIGSMVEHKSFGKGMISKIDGQYISINFNNGNKTFAYPGSFLEGYLKTDDPHINSIVANIMKSTKSVEKNDSSCSPQKVIPIEQNIDAPYPRVIFCNIAWMKNYCGIKKDDIPVNGGSYVKKNQRGNEVDNFLPITVVEDGIDERICYFGSFETMASNGSTSNQTHIEKIYGCKGLQKADFAEGVLVIWCATSKSGSSRIVGWYKNATVYRRYKEIEIENPDGSTEIRPYNIMCDIEDAVLLPESERQETVWFAPRKNEKKGISFGFFRANVWYASEPEAQHYVEKVVKRIRSYHGKNDAPKVL